MKAVSTGWLWSEKLTVTAIRYWPLFEHVNLSLDQNSSNLANMMAEGKLNIIDIVLQVSNFYICIS